MDVEIRWEGSIVMFQPLTDRAREWMSEYIVSEDWQWLGCALGVDVRYAGPLIDGMIDAGLEVG